MTELLRACLVLLRVPPATEAYKLRVLPFWRVSDAIVRVTEMAEANKGEVAMAALIPAIAAVASTLVASLELSRSVLLDVTRPDAWTPITVARSPAKLP